MTFIKIVVSLLLPSILAVGMIYVIHTLTSTNTPQEFEYKHHDYIYFPDKGVIHSPECKQCTLTFETI
jgi:hypothetical protein